MAENKLARISPEKLTIGEIAFVEEHTGKTLIDSLEHMDSKTMPALAACVIRRSDSTETSESALNKANNLTMGELMESINV